MDAIRGLQERVGLPVYLALTPIAGSRDRLSPAAAGSYALTQDDSFSAPCEAIDARPDYQTVIRPGYRNYVAYMVQRFNPRFLALSIEVNMYAANCPAAWSAMQRLLNETYEMVKADHPDLPTFHTVQVDVLWQANEPSSPCFGFQRDCFPALPSSLVDQAWWMQRLLADARRAQMPFVVWWANEDIMQLRPAARRSRLPSRAGTSICAAGGHLAACSQ